jgi:hypothetical protein
MIIIIVTAVETSNLTSNIFIADQSNGTMLEAEIFSGSIHTTQLCRCWSFEACAMIPTEVSIK